MLELGARAPIAIERPAAVLVTWPHSDGNAQRRPRSASTSFGTALLYSRIWLFLCANHRAGIQEKNQLKIGRGSAQPFAVRCRAFWSAPIGVLGGYWHVYMTLPGSKAPAGMPSPMGECEHPPQSKAKAPASCHGRARSRLKIEINRNARG